MAVMDLVNVPNGTRVFVDTNIFFLHFTGKSAACTAFIQRVQAGDIPAFVNSRVMLDLLHKLMLVEAFQKGMIPQPRAEKLKVWLVGNRANAGRLADYQTQFDSILALGIEMLRTTKKLLAETETERRVHALMVGDSLHLGCMNRHEPAISDPVTNDSDFDHVSSIRIWKPKDIA